MLAVQQERTGLADVLVKWLELENRFAPQKCAGQNTAAEEEAPKMN